MTDPLPPLLSLSIDPRARLVLFDIADDPRYVAMEVQVFDDDVHGRGLLALLARHDGTVDVHHQPGLRLERDPFAIGRGIGAWCETPFEPARVEIADDGIVVEVGLTDATGRRVELRIDDRDGVARTRSTLLAPVSSGVEDPHQLLVVLLRQFDLVRTSGTVPELRIDGVGRTITPFPGPDWVHHRRFMRYAAAPVIVTVGASVDGPVDPASLGPHDRLDAAIEGATAAVRFDPALPDLRTLADGEARSGGWDLDVAHATSLFGGTWTASREGTAVQVSMAITRPWQPRDLPRSLRVVTTVARVFREWPTTYAWSATVDLAATPPVARARWALVTGPDRANAYGLRVGRRSVLAAAGIAGAAIAVVGAVVLVRRSRSAG